MTGTRKRTGAKTKANPGRNTVAAAPPKARAVKTPLRPPAAETDTATAVLTLRATAEALHSALDEVLSLAGFGAESLASLSKSDGDTAFETIATAQQTLFAAAALLDSDVLPEPGPDTFDDDIGGEEAIEPAGSRRGGLLASILAAAAQVEATNARRIAGIDPSPAAKERWLSALTDLAGTLAATLSAEAVGGDAVAGAQPVDPCGGCDDTGDPSLDPIAASAPTGAADDLDLDPSGC